jgi:hypothetical protein
MRRSMSSLTVVLMLSASAAHAQVPDAGRAPGQAGSAAAQQLRQARYQIGQMERLLEGAVEHGATVIRDRLQPIMPADMLLTEDARARGFRLDGYGVFFDVEVPSLEGTLPWSFRTLDQNDLGLDAALRTLRSYVQSSAGNDVNLQQALKRVELQVAPMTVATTGQPAATAVQASSAGTADRAVTAPVNDPAFNNPDEAYRTEIREALIDAMLEHSRSLGVGPGERLTVAARRSDNRPRLGIDTDAGTVVLSVKGSDLTAFLSGEITPQEARSRIEVRVF